MKRFIALGFMAVICSLSLHAAESSLKVTLVASTKVGTSTLAAGDWKITWIVNGAAAQVTFQTAGQKSITFPAQVVEEKSDTDVLEIGNVKGVQVLQSVDLKNMKFILSPNQTSGN
jgi:hypothetical protein